MRTGKLTKIAFCIALTASAVTPILGQTRKRRPEPAKQQPAAALPEQAVHPTPTPVVPKRNERPQSGASTGNTGTAEIKPGETAPYRYEFSQPDFLVPFIRIEHSENGAGTISFRKKGEDELISDPIKVSPKALARINDALSTLDFLNSSESYQHEKDFAHLGNITFARTAAGKAREVKFNWTENKDARVLMDEYRKIGNQFLWIFDITVSRENQPLEAPRLFDSLDSLIRRNEISDPIQLEPFLRELANDESIPLIARNHASKLVKQFEKEKAKEDKKRADGSK